MRCRSIRGMQELATPETMIVELPGHPTMIRVVRTMANRAAHLASLRYDRVEDLGLAIDETATALLELAADTTLRTALTGSAHTVEFVMAVATSTEPWPRVNWSDSIGSMVLDSVATDVAFDSDGESTSIRVSVTN